VASETSVSGIAGLLARNWWVLLLRGIFAIVLGILIFTRPVVTLAAVVMVFGVYALIEGASALFSAISGWRHRDDRWLLLLEAVVGIWVGLITLRSPQITAVVLIFFIAVWALATGVLRIVEAIRLRREISGEMWLALSGVASIIFAFMVMLRPAAGALTLLWVLGGYALVLGVTEVILGFKLRGLRKIDHWSGAPDHMHRRAA
jgi:uncharacterized membrane protein HdeD (DUF308 family)